MTEREAIIAIGKDDVDIHTLRTAARLILSKYKMARTRNEALARAAGIWPKDRSTIHK
jgi:hypothetical protein